MVLVSSLLCCLMMLYVSNHFKSADSDVTGLISLHIFITHCPEVSTLEDGLLPVGVLLERANRGRSE